ncbi:MAG TPA: hypothetical protein VKB52_01120 [Rhodanobacteraceae bacterium]|nr:hypothetical protein [Rhodanobacteraceae bacterium]
MKATTVLMLFALASTQALATTTDDAAWTAYHASLHAAMRASDDPREWALAAFPPSDDVVAPEATVEADAELSRAAAQAPNDALVQWIVANNYAATEAKMVRVDAALSRLEAIEPDNAAVWMQALYRATRQHDDAAASRALAQMAESTRFDEHFADALHAWLAAYDRHPPAHPLPSVRDGDTTLSAAFAMAMSYTTAVAMPSYATITKTCDPAKEAVEGERRTHCEAIGRLLLGRGTTLIARSIGFALLRNLDVLTDSDRAENRNLDWYRANVPKGTGYEGGSASVGAAYEADWRRLDDEITVMRNALQRAGLPPDAPPGWTPAASRTAKR